MTVTDQPAVIKARGVSDKTRVRNRMADDFRAARRSLKSELLYYGDHFTPAERRRLRGLMVTLNALANDIDGK